MSRTMYNYVREAMVAARELGYEKIMPDVFSRIRNARSESEVARILRTCRESL